jgi:LacI family transcriptional regulator
MMEKRGRRATLADVAQAAGVSRATVSKALNGRDDVSAQTRERVLATVAELGYRPTTAVETMPSRHAIAVVFDIPASPYILGVLQGVLAATAESGFDLLTRLPPERRTRTQRAVAHDWVSDQVAAGAVGIVALTLPAPDALIDAASQAGLPFVMVDPLGASDSRMVSVASSNWAGARTATEHLLGLGHRRIAWIGGPEASVAARDRLYGYQAALDAAGIRIDPDLIRSDQFTVGTGAAHARELLALAEPPTAIMAGDDEIAVGVLATAHALGVRVPHDLSVTGFDDTPQAAWTTPPLTTVHQHLDGMGAMAVQTIRVMTEGRHASSRHVELATSLTVRESTSPPAR